MSTQPDLAAALQRRRVLNGEDSIENTENTEKDSSKADEISNTQSSSPSRTQSTASRLPQQSPQSRRAGRPLSAAIADRQLEQLHRELVRESSETKTEHADQPLADENSDVSPVARKAQQHGNVPPVANVTRLAPPSSIIPPPPPIPEMLPPAQSGSTAPCRLWTRQEKARYNHRDCALCGGANELSQIKVAATNTEPNNDITAAALESGNGNLELANPRKKLRRRKAGHRNPLVWAILFGTLLALVLPLPIYYFASGRRWPWTPASYHGDDNGFFWGLGNERNVLSVFELLQNPNSAQAWALRNAGGILLFDAATNMTQIELVLRGITRTSDPHKEEVAQSVTMQVFTKTQMETAFDFEGGEKKRLFGEQNERLVACGILHSATRSTFLEGARCCLLRADADKANLHIVAPINTDFVKDHLKTFLVSPNGMLDWNMTPIKAWATFSAGLAEPRNVDRALFGSWLKNPDKENTAAECWIQRSLQRSNAIRQGTIFAEFVALPQRNQHSNINETLVKYRRVLGLQAEDLRSLSFSHFSPERAVLLSESAHESEGSGMFLSSRSDQETRGYLQSETENRLCPRFHDAFGETCVLSSGKRTPKIHLEILEWVFSDKGDSEEMTIRIEAKMFGPALARSELFLEIDGQRVQSAKSDMDGRHTFVWQSQRNNLTMPVVEARSEIFANSTREPRARLDLAKLQPIYFEPDHENGNFSGKMLYGHIFALLRNQTLMDLRSGDDTREQTQNAHEHEHDGGLCQLIEFAESVSVRNDSRLEMKTRFPLAMGNSDNGSDSNSTTDFVYPLDTADRLHRVLHCLQIIPAHAPTNTAAALRPSVQNTDLAKRSPLDPLLPWKQVNGTHLDQNATRTLNMTALEQTDLAVALGRALAQAVSLHTYPKSNEISLFDISELERNAVELSEAEVEEMHKILLTFGDRSAAYSIRLGSLLLSLDDSSARQIVRMHFDRIADEKLQTQLIKLLGARL